jgi:hypothetical protein
MFVRAQLRAPGTVLGVRRWQLGRRARAGPGRPGRAGASRRRRTRRPAHLEAGRPRSDDLPLRHARGPTPGGPRGSPAGCVWDASASFIDSCAVARAAAISPRASCTSARAAVARAQLSVGQIGAPAPQGSESRQAARAHGDPASCVAGRPRVTPHAVGVAREVGRAGEFQLDRRAHLRLGALESGSQSLVGLDARVEELLRARARSGQPRVPRPGQAPRAAWPGSRPSVPRPTGRLRAAPAAQPVSPSPRPAAGAAPSGASARRRQGSGGRPARSRKGRRPQRRRRPEPERARPGARARASPPRGPCAAARSRCGAQPGPARAGTALILVLIASALAGPGTAFGLDDGLKRSRPHRPGGRSSLDGGDRQVFGQDPPWRLDHLH